MQVNNLLDQNGYLHVKNVIDKKLCNYLTSALLLNSSINNINNNSIKNEDVQVPNTLTFLGQSLLFDTLLENIWPVLENNINEELLPTYSYARLYKNGNILTKHKDRPSCEISVTIQLGRSHHYAWPIFIEGKRFDLDEGDGLIYKGCEVQHWRDECKGPDEYYSGQVFLHYVRSNGQFKDWAGDKRWEKLPFVRGRNFLMNVK